MRKGEAYHACRNEFSAENFSKSPHATQGCADHSQIVPTIGCSIEVLTAISHIVDTVLEKEVRDDLQSVEVVKKLERRLKYSQQKTEAWSDETSSDTLKEMRHIAELYRMSGLIYLHRVTGGIGILNYQLQELVDDAFAILTKLRTCERTFPLFILGCEARDDVRRGAILRILRETEAEFAPGNIISVRQYLERFWAQEDLDVEQEVGYGEKITAVLSSSDSLPAFT